jgi:hypothetical protein
MMRFEYPGVTRGQAMRSRLKHIFKVADGTSEDLGDDEDEVWLAAAWDYLDTADGAAEERRRYPRGCDAAEHAAFVQSIARRLRLRANNNDDDKRDSFQPWPDADDDNDDAERVTATKSFSMRPRDEILRRLCKSAGGVVALAKQIVRDGDSDVSEHELTWLIVEHAKAEHPDMTDAQAFSKAFGSASPAGETLRRAVAIAKGAPAPTLDSDDDDDIGGSADALAELTRHAERLRAAQPALSREQALARIMSDPQHARLVRRERRQNNPVLKLAR